jgi:hypothetical protein
MNIYVRIITCVYITTYIFTYKYASFYSIYTICTRIKVERGIDKKTFFRDNRLRLNQFR